MAYKDINQEREYQRHHYQLNKDVYLARTKVSNQKIKQRNMDYVNEIKANPCVDCGNTFHFSAMDFDHLSDKEMNVAKLARMAVSLDRVKAEIAKCELVCSNCHRIRTWERVNKQ